MESATFVVVGGGIAGVSCAERLAFLEPNESIILISESALIKTVTNLSSVTRTLVNFDVVEESSNDLSKRCANITVVHGTVAEINSEQFRLKTDRDQIISYKFLCLCVGAEAKLIPQAQNCPQIVGIRDTDSVEKFVAKLANCKTIVIVGNGGIASELVYKIANVDVHWVVKDKHITATFVDAGAAEFFQSALIKSNTPPTAGIVKRMRFDAGDNFSKSGAALGPDWFKHLNIRGGNNSNHVNVHYESEIASVACSEKLCVVLTNGDVINECDLIVSATGVHPRCNFVLDNLNRGLDGGVKVNEFMQTNLPKIYAAGDVCEADWPHAKHWFPMKLWTQARQMGCYAAGCMSAHFRGDPILQDFCFEMFAHSTRLFGYKVVLLGLFNGQKLGSDYEILLRMTKGREYVKFVLAGNKLQGAVLIGDTDLEETVENLILNQLDLEPYGDDLLDPDVDIEDYFD